MIDDYNQSSFQMENWDLMENPWMENWDLMDDGRYDYI